MRGSFAGGCERPRSLALELAQEDEVAEGLAEEEKAEDACGMALQASRFPRFSWRKRSMARSRGSVKSSGASGGRGGRSPAKKEAVRCGSRCLMEGRVHTVSTVAL